MARRRVRRRTKTTSTHAHAPLSGPSGKPLAALGGTWRASIRAICRDLIGTHSTEIAYQIRNGMLSENKKTALKYLMFATGYSEGKPVEMNRMPTLSDEQDTFDIDKLSDVEQKKLLRMLQFAMGTKSS